MYLCAPALSHIIDVIKSQVIYQNNWTSLLTNISNMGTGGLSIQLDNIATSHMSDSKQTSDNKQTILGFGFKMPVILGGKMCNKIT